MSKPPKPGFPVEAKYKVALSSAMNGKLSFPSVLTLGPKFSGFPKLPPLTETFQISTPPTLPGILEEKYSVLPSLLKLGLLNE